MNTLIETIGVGGIFLLLVAILILFLTSPLARLEEEDKHQRTIKENDEEFNLATK